MGEWIALFFGQQLWRRGRRRDPKKCPGGTDCPTGTSLSLSSVHGEKRRRGFILFREGGMARDDWSSMGLDNVFDNCQEIFFCHIRI